MHANVYVRFLSCRHLIVEVVKLSSFYAGNIDVILEQNTCLLVGRWQHCGQWNSLCLPSWIYLFLSLYIYTHTHSGLSIVERFGARTTRRGGRGEKTPVWNTNNSSKVEPWIQHCTASCGSCHRESTNKNAASWVLLVCLHNSTSSSAVIRFKKWASACVVWVVCDLFDLFSFYF
jgi:hypothetical protein